MAVDAKRAIVPYLREFDEQEKKLVLFLLKQMAPKATPEEHALFLYTAQKKGLDPFNKQIYLVPRYDSQSNGLKHAIQVSIDGLRLLASRSGQYAGQVGPQWCGKDGKWVDVWLADEPPSASRVGVLRHDFKEPLWSVALWKSYAQKKKDGSLNSFWNNFGPHMLEKCADALSIRRAFPEETSGYYIPEEMGNAEAHFVTVTPADSSEGAEVVTSEVVDEEKANEQQLASIRKLCERLGKPEPENADALSFNGAKELIGQLTQEYRSHSASPAKPPAQEEKRPSPEDVERMKKFYGRVFSFKSSDFDKRWEAAKVHVLKRPVADPDLSFADLDALRKYAASQEKAQLAASSAGK